MKKNKFQRNEYNQKLLDELEKGKLSPELRLLYYYLCRDVLNQKRYIYLTEEIRDLCVIDAYESCLRFWQKFNRERSDDAYAYYVIVIRSSVAGTWCKHRKDKKHEGKEDNPHG